MSNTQTRSTSSRPLFNQPLLIPLPNPRCLDLSKPEALRNWQASVPAFRRNTMEMAEFWNRMPPLTAPQYAALRLGRPLSWVSLTTIRSTYERLTRARYRQGSTYEWSLLRGYTRIWDRSHRDDVFRLNPSKIRQRCAPASLFAPLMDWVTPDVTIERRFLLAGFPPYVSYQKRRAITREALRVGVLRGYIEMCGSITVPAWAYRPTAKWCRSMDIPERRWKESAIDHGQLAVEAALAALSRYGEFTDTFAFQTEADVLATSRASQQIRRGDVLGSVPDLVAIDAVGRRRGTEIISENYRDTKIASKYEGLRHLVDLVATSAPVARRVAAATGAPCLHF